MEKLKIWKDELPFDERERIWQEQAIAAKKIHPLKELGSLPRMVGITKETKRFLRWKSLLWMIRKDERASIFKSVMRRPFYYISRLLRSYWGAYPVKETGDFYLYGLSSLGELKDLLKKEDTVFIAGFSYCHKPLECPSGRFTEDCIHDVQNVVCQQCFIGKAINQLPCQNTQFVIIKTVHHIGRSVFTAIEKNPGKRVVFLITACEMTLKMFGDYGHMAGVVGAGVKLAGRICNTMRAFELSETGIKPGLTVVHEETQKTMMDLIRVRQESLIGN